jgi:hypothetical protein
MKVRLSEEETLKLLKIQATTLMKLDRLAKTLVSEIADQKQFLRRVLINLDEADAHKEKKEHLEKEEEDLRTQELPTNVLLFPANDDWED